MWSFQQLLRGQDRLRNLADFFLLSHSGGSHQHIGLVFRQALHLHQDSLGAVDHFAILERGFGAFELVLQLGESIEARDAEVEDRLDALF